MQASSKIVGASLVVGGIALLFIFALIVDYSSLLVESFEAKRLRVDNHKMKKELTELADKVQLMEASVDRMQVAYKKIKMITQQSSDRETLDLSLNYDRPQEEATRAHSFHPQRDVSSLGGPDRDPEDLFTLTTVQQTHDHSLEWVPDFSALKLRVEESTELAELEERNLLELWNELSDRQEFLDATPSIKPVNGLFTSHFGYRKSPFTGRPVMHSGIDFAASIGTAVSAPADGIVKYVGYHGSYGKLVTLSHGYGVETRYAHNSRIYVKKGQKITRGQVISAVGNTGKSTGPHLHYEVRVHGIPVNPLNYIIE